MMTIRDLTNRQRYLLTIRMKKRLKEFKKAHHLKQDIDTAFMHGYNAGAKATLERMPDPVAKAS